MYHPRVGGMWLEELSGFSHDPVSFATLPSSLGKEVDVLQGKQMIAVCGLNCATCNIREATHDAAVAQSIADWFKEELDTVKLRTFTALVPGENGRNTGRRTVGFCNAAWLKKDRSTARNAKRSHTTNWRHGRRRASDTPGLSSD